MFSGIVAAVGTVKAFEGHGEAASLTVEASPAFSDIAIGESIAVNGVCLTVAALVEEAAPASVSKPVLWTADVMQETLDKSSLHGIQPGDHVNLERAVRADQRLGGHIVQGHVDGVGTLLSRDPAKHWDLVRISAPAELLRYVAPKGSIAVDGVSLTVIEVDDASTSFTVGLIPTTLELTVLGRIEPGATVNLEVDVIAKYVERLLTAQKES
jgi:riboflavin synthase